MKDPKEISRAKVEEAFTLLDRGDRKAAGEHLLVALEVLDDILDPEDRRVSLGALALLLQRVGFPDLSLMAVEEALELDAEIGNPSDLAQNLVTRGNAHGNLGNSKQAEADYNRALETFLHLNELHNAASSTTNLALLVGRGGGAKATWRRSSKLWRNC